MFPTLQVCLSAPNMARRVAKGKRGATKRGRNMSADEKQVVRRMYHDQGQTPPDIAEFFGRHHSCHKLVKKADGNKERGATERGTNMSAKHKQIPQQIYYS